MPQKKIILFIYLNIGSRINIAVKAAGFLTAILVTAWVCFPAVATFHLQLPQCIKLATFPSRALCQRNTKWCPILLYGV
jgi:hypothetical protein